MLPTLSRLSVSIGPGSRLRHWCSFQYLRISPLHWKFRFPLPYSRMAVSDAIPRLSLGLSHPTHHPAYTLFTTNDSEQRLHRITAAAGTELAGAFWTGTVRTRGYCSSRVFVPVRQSFTTRRPSSLTRRRCVRLSPIAQYSPLLPPVGVWTVSQFQCGWTSSQTSYPS